MNDKLREAVDQCDEDVFTNGVSLGFFDMTKEQAEQYCKAETERTGRKHDWHYMAGRVHIKAMREALAASKPEPLSESCVSVAMSPCQFSGICKYCKPEPQAQAADPEVVAYALGDGLFDTPLDYEHSRLYGTGTPLITLQSHREAMEAQRKAIEFEAFEYRERIVPELREAIAKKDAALDACVEALESYSKSPYVKKEHPKRHAAGNAAITKAKESRQ